jgi:hypothetical protein
LEILDFEFTADDRQIQNWKFKIQNEVRMFSAYFDTVKDSPLDWVILTFGLSLIAAQLFGLFMRYEGQKILFVQKLDRYRTFCLMMVELLPVLGLLGTVLALMNTFKTFQIAADETPDLSNLIRAFAPALSTTISGMMMVVPNLLLNAVLWTACPKTDNREV